MKFSSLCLRLWLAVGISIAAWSEELPLEAGSDVVGRLYVIAARYEDSISRLAVELGLGYTPLADANPGVDVLIPGEGTLITLPTLYVLPQAPRRGIVVNLAEYRLYLYPPDRNVVVTYPIGIGRSEFPTPAGLSRITIPIENPSWTPPDSIRAERLAGGEILPGVVPPGPDNPLGDLALMLDRPGYLIHGTNKPAGIGQRVSHGCIRLYPADILELARRSGRGTEVRIVSQPFKAGVQDGEIYVEYHRVEGVDANAAAHEAALKALPGAERIDWERVREVVVQARGIPTRVTKESRGR